MFLFKCTAKYFFLILTVSFSQFAFCVGQYVDMVFHNEGSGLSLAVPYDDRLLGESISVSNSSIKNNKFFLEYPDYIWLPVLSKFYSLAKNNNVKEIVNLHYSKDGSKHRLESRVSKNQNVFKGFSKVTSIEIGSVYAWGSYSAVAIKWIANGKVLGRWAHLFYCKETLCEMSDRLLEQDDSFELLSRLMFLEKSKGIKRRRVSQDGRKSISLYSSDSRAILYKFDPILFQGEKPQNIFLGKSSSKDNDVEHALYFLGGFMKEITSFYQSHPLADGGHESALGAIYSKYWDNDYSRQFVQNYVLEAGQRSVDSVEVKTALLTRGVVAKRISEAKGISPKFYFSDSEYIYIWFSAEKYQGKPMFVFAYDKKSKKIISPLSSDLWAVLLNAKVAEKIVNEDY